MQTKHIVMLAAVVAALIILSWLRSRRTNSPPAGTLEEISIDQLNDGERKVQSLIREVHGDAILTERFVREAGDVKDQLRFDTNKATLQSLSVNLSSLARKQRNEGLSDGALKASLKF